jgi:hypothetical protein
MLLSSSAIAHAKVQIGINFIGVTNIHTLLKGDLTTLDVYVKQMFSLRNNNKHDKSLH